MKSVDKKLTASPARIWGRDMSLMAMGLLVPLAAGFMIQASVEATAFWKVMIGPPARLVPVVMVAGTLLIVFIVRRSRSSYQSSTAPVWDRELDGLPEAKAESKG